MHSFIGMNEFHISQHTEMIAISLNKKTKYKIETYDVTDITIE